MENTKKGVNAAQLAICACISAALCFLLGSTIWLSPLIGLPVIYAWIKAGHLVGAVMSAGTAALLTLMYGQIGMVCAVLSVPCMAAVGIACRKNVSPFWTLALSAGAIFAGIGAIAVYINASTGKDIAAYLADMLTEAAAQNDSYALLAFMGSAGVELAMGNMSYDKLLEMLGSMDAIRSYIATDAAESALNTYFTQTASMIAGAVPVYAGVCCACVPRAVACRLGAKLTPVPKFDRFILPKKYAMYCVGTFILSMLLILFNARSLFVAAQILYTAMNAVFSLQGMSLMYFLLGQKIKSKGARGLIIAAIFVLFSVVGLDVFVLLGLMEQIFRVREGFFAVKGGDDR